MTSISITHHQQQRELDSLIEYINEFINNLRASKKAVYDFANNCKYCYELRKQRKLFGDHIDFTKKSFLKLSEKNQSELELHYFRGLKELNALLPAAEKEINQDFIFPINWFLLREIKKTIALITDGQAFMANILYPDNSKTVQDDADLMAKMNELWADCDDY